MAQQINDNFQNYSPKSLDNKYLRLGTLAYTSVNQANSTILSPYRSRGLTVLIDLGAGALEYWYKEGILDSDLVPKGSEDIFQNWQQTLIVGSTLTQNNTIIGAGTNFTFSNIGSFTLDSNEIHITLPTAAGYVLTDTAGDGNLTMQPVITSSWRAILTAGETTPQQLNANSTTFIHITGIGNLVVIPEDQSVFIVPDSCTAERLFVRVSGVQPLSGSLVFTLRKNFVDTILVTTVPAGSVTGVFSDTTHQVSLTAGDVITMKVVNNASNSSISVQASAFSLFHT